MMLENKNYQSVLDDIIPNSMKFSNGFIDAIVRIPDGVDIEQLAERKVYLTLRNTLNAYDYQIYNLKFRWWLPDGFVALGKKSATLMHKNDHQTGTLNLEFVIKTSEEIKDINRCVLEIESNERPTILYIPITLIG